VARLDPPAVETLSPEHKAVHDKIRGNRPKLGGPFGVLLHNPPVAVAASGLVDVLRAKGTLEPRIYELIVLTVVRHWSAQYAWAVHEPLGRNAGLSDATIEALRARKKPAFDKADEALVHEAVTELLTGKVLGANLYERLVKQYGLATTIELVSVAGLYNMISTVLNGFDVPTLNGETPFG
jgi:4-carboxymuconolactone decarboxylase